MDVPRRVIEEAVRLMRQNRGSQALDVVRNHDITTFGQLERWCRHYGIRSWREEPETRADDGTTGAEES